MSIVNISISKNQQGAPAESTPQEIQETAQQPIETKETQKEVVLAGSLSKVYTDALNSVLANEGINLMGEPTFNEEDIIHNNIYDGDFDESKLFVYTEDGDSLDQKGLIDGVNSLGLANKKFKDKLLALESSGNNPKAALLHSYAASLGIPVYVTRKSSLSAIVNK